MSIVKYLAPSPATKSAREQQVEVVFAKMKFGTLGVIVGAVLATVPDFIPFIPFV